MRSLPALPTIAGATALAGLLAVPAPASAWGFEAHQFIVGRAIALLPPEIRPFFEANRTFLVEHTLDPDLWRVAGFTEESPRHFLNLDAYGAYPFADLPRAYDAALERFGAGRLAQNGILPWRAAETADRLREAFEALRRGGFARRDVAFFTAVVAHYVADAHVPFHAVLNFDGQLTGQRGIHARWESDLFTRYERRLTVTPAPVRRVPEVRDLVFETLLSGFQLAEGVLAADRDAIGGRDVYDERYYEAFFAASGPVLERRLGEAVTAVASIVASAWEQAGRPPLPAAAPAPAPRRRDP
jgi:hypothetical protein